MGDPAIRMEKRGAILGITLDRPAAMNAIDQRLADDLSRAAEQAQEDATVRVVVLSGAGKAFCAGGDISLLAGFSGLSAAAIADRVYGLQEKIGRIAFVDKPVIASIHGYALGAGLSLAMLCDIRVAAGSAVFGMEFVKVGIVPEVGARLTLPRLVGAGRALELVMTGERLGSREAERAGLITRVVPDDELQEVTSNLAEQLAGLPPLALRRIKKSFQEEVQSRLLDAFRYEAEANAACYLSRDFQEAARAFRDKRPPVFEGS